MDKLLTIVVPVYNVRKYLRKCIDSILAQEYKNFEAILVDDGCKDDCGAICDEYKEKDSRIVVIHKPNGGLSSARNAALDIAKGDYIGFVDSDDWIEPNMYSEMIHFLEQNDCTMVECAINLADDTSIKEITSKENEIISGREALKRHLDEATRYAIPRPSVWSKLYKRDFWMINRFPVGQIHEDYLLTCMAIYESERYGIINKGLYNHLVSNPTSIINTKFSKRDLYKEKQCLYRIDYLSKTGDEELIEMAKVSYYCYLVTAAWLCDQNNMPEKWEFVSKVKRDKDEISKLSFTRNKKIDLFLMMKMPNMFFLFRRLLAKARNMK